MVARCAWAPLSLPCDALLRPRAHALTRARTRSIAESMMSYVPERRVTAYASLRHPYFSDLGAGLLEAPDTASIFSVPGIRLDEAPVRRRSVANVRTTNSATQQAPAYYRY